MKTGWIWEVYVNLGKTEEKSSGISSTRDRAFCAAVQAAAEWVDSEEVDFNSIRIFLRKSNPKSYVV